jgi:multiple sugar transport system substrate-binding protein
MEVPLPSDLSSFWTFIEIPANNSSGRTAGFVLPDAGMKSLAPFVWSDGGELVSEDCKRADGYLNDSKNTGVFDKFAASLESGGIILADGEADALSMFADGKAVMTILSTNELAGFTSTYPDFRFETAPFPSGPAGSVAILNCNYVCITKTADKDAAAAFLESVISSDAIMEADPRFPVPEQSLISARPLPMSYSMSDMNNEFLLAMKRITEGYMTTQEALDDLAMKWDAYL